MNKNQSPAKPTPGKINENRTPTKTPSKGSVINDRNPFVSQKQPSSSGNTPPKPKR